MAVNAELETRLRRGLRAAAETIPPAPPEPSAVTAYAPSVAVAVPTWRRRLLPGLGAAAAATALVTAAVVVLSRGDGKDVELVPSQEPDAETATPPPDDTTTVPEPHTPIQANGMVPGQAVIVGGTIHLYGPDGSETGSVETGQQQSVQDGTSDLAGGWVVCGDQATWIKADGQQAPVPGGGIVCWADAMTVVDSPEGPTVIGYGGPITDGFVTTVLSTGQTTHLQLPLDQSVMYRWSATTGRLLLASDNEIKLYDISTGQPSTMLEATPDLSGPISDVALSHDGTKMAALTGFDSTTVTVYDLETGDVVFQDGTGFPAEGAELSFDGTTLAVGSWYDGHGPVEVIDIASGARHTIDAHGVVL